MRKLERMVGMACLSFMNVSQSSASLSEVICLSILHTVLNRPIREAFSAPLQNSPYEAKRTVSVNRGLHLM